jgi:DNA-binding transcriptional regulator GbsR (MarR family)
VNQLSDRDLELHYTEAMGRFFESGGLARMAGRIWAYLLIADAPRLSAQDLGEALGASAGAVSGATRSLVELGLIDRIRVPGERRDYFAPRRGAIAELLRVRLQRLTTVELLISDALEQFGDREYARPRLEEIHTLYHWYARELPKLHERFLAEQQELTGNSRKE